MPLAPVPSTAVRARSRTLREVAARVLPRSLVVVRGPRGRARRVALTFDDGPDTMTPRYLDLLDALGLRATFFLVGENAARHPALVAEYVRRGHEIGAHGWSHDPFATMSPERLTDELERTEAVLPRHRMHGSPMVRPPRGALTPAALVRVAARGFVTVLWSVDSDDCRTTEPARVEHALSPSRVAPGDIVLLHEMQPWTLEALPAVVRRLRAAGLETTTVSELFATDASRETRR
jgi:peptidoglycan/xylan/chitin deacetylase (PgdA/CDA1 family)